MNFFKLNKLLLNSLEDKFIIFGAGYKGGIGKSVLSLGLAKEFNIPYITNDQGSAISGNVNFYDNTYLTYDFKSDSRLKEAKVVIIDLAGCFVLDKTILKLIKRSNLIILPTGENPYLDHTGCLITANNLFGNTPMNVLDSPATTSSTTYEAFFKSSSGNAEVMAGGSSGIMILMEIGA